MLVHDLVLEFAKLTDGHLVAGLTDECNVDDDGEVIDNGRIDFSDFEFFAPFPDLHRLVLSDCGSTIANIAGTGVAGFSGDGGRAVNARLASPTAAVRGPDGDIYIADRDNNRIRRLIPDRLTPDVNTVRNGTITTFIGARDPSDTTPTPFTPTLENGQPLELDRPSGLAVDHTGALLIADATHRIQRVVMVDSVERDEVRGDVTTIIGTGEPGDDGDDLPATSTRLNEPTAIVFLPFSALAGQVEFPLPDGGLLLIAERGGHRIRALLITDALTQVYTLAGTGQPGDVDAADGLAASFTLPRGVMVASPTASAERLGFFVVDAIDRVRTMDLAVSFSLAGLELSTSVGTATASLAGQGLPSRDDGEGTGLFRTPGALTFLDDDRVAVVDTFTGRLRVLTLSSSSLRTVAGMPAGTVAGPLPTSAFVTEPLKDPGDVVFDEGSSTLWVSEGGAGRLRRFLLVDPADPATWQTSAVVVAGLTAPAGLALDARSRRLYVADKGSHVVVAVDIDAVGLDVAAAIAGRDVVVTAEPIAGIAGQRGFAGDGREAVSALLNEPSGLAVAGGRHLYVADTGNNRVRRVDLQEGLLIRSVLGDGNGNSGGEGAPSTSFPVDSPRALAIDATGNLIVTSELAIRLVQANDDGVINGTSAVSTIYGNTGVFPETITRCISGLAITPSTSTNDPATLYALDSCVGLVVRLTRD